MKVLYHPHHKTNSADSENISRHFEELASVLDKYELGDKPHRIFNTKETKIALEHESPIADAVSDSDTEDETTTILGCGSASGIVMPPYFIFSGPDMREEWLQGSSPGASGTVSDDGLSNSRVFLTFLQDHFCKFIPGDINEDEPVLLLVDGHRADINITVMEWAKQKNIILHVLPVNTSHVLQPLDVGCYGPLESFYTSICQKHIQTSGVITKHDVCS